MADALIHDAVADLAGLHECLDGAQAADLIDGIDVVIVAVEVGLLGVHILPQSSPQIARLQVVGGQGVSGHQPVDKAVPHQGGKGGQESASKEQAGPMTHRIFPCSRSWRSRSYRPS